LKKKEVQKVQISGIVNTITDSEKGSGLLGFVITFPDGKMQNTAIEYNSTNHQEIATIISDLYRKAKAKYGKVMSGNSKTARRKKGDSNETKI
jgi:hypothetical protein